MLKDGVPKNIARSGLRMNRCKWFRGRCSQVQCHHCPLLRNGLPYKMLNLPDVTLVVADSVVHDLSRLVIAELCNQIKFGDVVTFSDEKLTSRGRQYHAQTANLDEAMSLLWYRIPLQINTSHFLYVQWDSGILDVDQWRDEFLEYDYIGAPWGWHHDEFEIGNGGFSLRSTKLTKFLIDNIAEFPRDEPEDDVLCRRYRPYLEHYGFKFAPIELASRFSVERSRVFGVDKHFGFHGIFNWPLLSQSRLDERMRLIPEYAKQKIEYQQLLVLLQKQLT